MRRIPIGLIFCVLAAAACSPGGRNATVPAARSGPSGIGVPQAIARATPPLPPAFVPKPPSTGQTAARGRRPADAAQAAFFVGASSLGNGAYYLAFPNGNIFGYYSYLSDPNYIYHFDMGYEYVVDAHDNGGGVYLYDFASSHWWYTSRSYAFPYLYDFSLAAVLYYYPDTGSAGHYSTNPRWFHNFGTGGDVQLPAPAITAKTVQRANAQALLTVAKVLDTGGYSPGGSTLGAMGRGRRMQGRRSPRSATCNPGGANGNGSVSVDDTTDAQGEHQSYNDFYDAHCTQPERVTTLNMPPGSTISVGTSTGFTTEYNRAGAVIGYATNQQSYDANVLTVQTIDAKTPGGAPVGRSGATCVASSATSERCGTASFITAGGVAYGLVETVTVTYGNSGQFTYTSSGAYSATTYAGSNLSLVVPPAGNTQWGLTGGSALDTLGGNTTAAYNGSLATALDYTQPASGTGGYTATAHISGFSTLTITIAKSGVTVATVIVDGDGNGSVTYASDNAVETVAGFTIFG